MTENNNKSDELPKKNNLLTRILSALVMLPIAVYIILKGELSYFILVTLLASLILFEWNNICEGKSKSLVFICQMAVMIYAVSAQYFERQVDFLFVGIGFIIVILVAHLTSASKKWAALGVLYAVIPSISLVWLRDFSADGGYYVLWSMIIVWSMDTGAYFAGKNIGGPKMAPKISPNKTWSGLIGGTLLAVITATIAAHYFEFHTSYWQLILFAAILAVWSQIGDLYESSLKRRFNVKDSGAIIPGHGGIMDRVDGVVFVIPLVAITLQISKMI